MRFKKELYTLLFLLSYIVRECVRYRYYICIGLHALLKIYDVGLRVIVLVLVLVLV